MTYEALSHCVAKICLLLLLLPASLSLQAAQATDFPKATIAVVGGTYMNDALLKKKELIKGSFTIKTKVGVSPTIYACSANGIPFYWARPQDQ